MLYEYKKNTLSTSSTFSGRPSAVTRKLQHFGFGRSRSLFWAWTDPKNFGDWIGPLIFEAKTGKRPLHSPVYRRFHEDKIYVTCGSIMECISAPEIAIVWGAGVMNRTGYFEKPHKIYSVRGPQTRKRCLELGYKCPELYGDPGIALPLIIGESKQEPTYDLGIIPHFVDWTIANRFFSSSSNITIIDVRKSVQEVVQEIQLCRRTVSSSLHGLIVSHAYGRQSAWVSFGGKLAGDNVKFYDYFLASGLSEIEGAHRIDESIDIDDLIRLSKSSQLPRLDRLAERVLSECPF